MTIKASRFIATIGARELAQVRAGSVLAVSEKVFSSGVHLAASAPSEAFEPAGSGSGVALLRVMGPLAQRRVDDLCGYVEGYDGIAERLESALANPDVGAVVMVIDSPGGDVAGLEAGLARMIEARDSSKKPVYAYVDELAASAAYWIASAIGSAGIYAPEAALIGSIGCIGAVVDATQSLEKEGLKVTLVRDPDGKAESHPYGPDEKLAAERVGELVKSASARFHAAVATHRKIDVKAVRGLNGAVLEAPKALAAALIDGVESFKATVQRAAAEIQRNKTMDDNTKIALAARAATKLDATASADAVIGAIGALEAKALRGVELEAANMKREQQEKLDAAAAEGAARKSLIASLHAERKLHKTQFSWAETQSVESLKSFAASAPTFAPEAIKDAKVEDSDDVREEGIGLNPEEEKVAAMLGVSVAELRAVKAAKAS